MRAQLLELTEKGLDNLYRRLDTGELRLGELPLAVEQFVSYGWAEGIAHARQQAAQQARDYEHRLNVLWMQAYTPKERHAEYQRRLDEHFRLEEQRFFAADEGFEHDRNNTRTADAHQQQRAA